MPSFARDGVGRPEADAAHVAGQPVRVLGHDLDGLVAVGLEDANRPGRADPVGVQEDHDLPHGLLLGPAATMRSARFGPMPPTSVRRSGRPR